MRAQYLAFVHRQKGPALLGIPRSESLFASSAGTHLIQGTLDRALCMGCIDAVVSTRRALTAELHGINMAFAPLFDEHQAVEAVLALAVDLADLPMLLNEAQRPLRFTGRLLAEFPHPLLTARPAGEIDFLNRQWYAVTGAKMTDPPRVAFFAALESEHRPAAQERWRAGVVTKREFSFELRLYTVTGPRWYLLRAEPIRQGARIVKWTAALTDIDAGVAAREALARSERQLRFLAEATRLLGACNELPSLARWLAELGARGGEWWAFELGLSGHRVSVSRPTNTALAEMIRPHVRSHWSDRVTVELEGGRHGLALPVAGRDDYGFLAVAAPMSPEALLAERAPVLHELAARLAVVIERILARERELRVLESLQRAMLPSALPEVRGIALDVAYTPAASEELVGGDWYDVFELGEGRLGITIGDVSGHGIDAAIIMNKTRQMLRAVGRDLGDPAQVLAHANRLLFEDERALATAFYGVLDTLTMRLHYASAGHPAPLVVNSAGAVRRLKAEGTILGVAAEASAREFQLQIEAEGALVLYTDGVIEAGRDYDRGEEVLRDVLARWANDGFRRSASELQAAVIGDRNNSDDAAMLIVRLPAVDRLVTSLPATPQNARRLRYAVERFVAGTGLAGSAAFDATLAIAEAINNVVQHAYAEEDMPGEVRVVLRRVRGGLVATVEDDGCWPHGRDEPPGHGLDIMRRLVPVLSVRRRTRGSKISFRVGQAPRPLTGALRLP